MPSSKKKRFAKSHERGTSSIFTLNTPDKIHGSCEAYARDPPTFKVPDATDSSRRMAMSSVLFPDPTGPTTAVRAPGGTVKETF